MLMIFFCVFDNENDAKLFFDFINSQHPNIKFTIEKETNKVLAFLDVCIDNNDPSCLKTSTYRKRLSLDCSLIFSALLPSLTK